MTPDGQKKQVVVSITSFPEAVPYAAQAIQSILNGSVLPDKVVLYLTFSQFGKKGLPDCLKALTASSPIFEIRNYDENIHSYRKLIPAFEDFPEAVIVTIDDDVKYHKDMLRDLLSLHEQIPDAVLANRAKRIKIGKPYKKWKKYRWYDFIFKKIHRDFTNLQTGVGGVLYPPHSLKPEMLDVATFTKIAPTTDDIWFWAAAVANGVHIVTASSKHNKPKGLHKPKGISLKTFNFKGGIDKNAAALNAVFEHYPEIKAVVCAPKDK